MAAKKTRAPTLAERMTAAEVWMETTFAQISETIGDKIALRVAEKIAEAVADLASKAEHVALETRVRAAEAQIAALLGSVHHAQGAATVEHRNRTEGQEWARTLTPLAFAIGATIVGALWTLRL